MVSDIIGDKTNHQAAGRARVASAIPCLCQAAGITRRNNNINILTIIGLTGGIASGKTLIGRLLAESGGTIIDADKIAHQVLKLPAVKQTLRARYGHKVFNQNGSVDNARLAAVTFGSRRNISWLNKLVHPLIRERILGLIDRAHQNTRSRAKFIILDAALLMETGLADICNTVIFVDAAKHFRQARALTRHNWPAGELDRRERSQMPLQTKKKKAHFIIDNNGRTKSKLAEQIKKIVKFLATLSPA